jgi:hypothetical protein
MRYHFVAFVAALLVAPAAYAQNPPAQNQPVPASGPLVLERIPDTWVLAPDFKVTDVDGRSGELAGAYGGKIIDNTLLIGGAGYWLANDARDFKMVYGGVIVGWQSPEFGRIRFGGRGLAGLGSATLGFELPGRGLVPDPLAPRGDIRGDIRFGVPDPRAALQAPRGAPVPPRIVGRDDFAVFEPQANVSARITKAIGVSCGVGYRQTAGADLLRDRVDGPTANLAVEFGW